MRSPLEPLKLGLAGFSAPDARTRPSSLAFRSFSDASPEEVMSLATFCFRAPPGLRCSGSPTRRTSKVPMEAVECWARVSAAPTPALPLCALSAPSSTGIPGRLEATPAAASLAVISRGGGGAGARFPALCSFLARCSVFLSTRDFFSFLSLSQGSSKGSSPALTSMMGCPAAGSPPALWYPYLGAHFSSASSHTMRPRFCFSMPFSRANFCHFVSGLGSGRGFSRGSTSPLAHDGRDATGPWEVRSVGSFHSAASSVAVASVAARWSMRSKVSPSAALSAPSSTDPGSV
mmetsp:Transcript_28006/g.62480  ORF Transcript_28006/g.62480 Transcript_28006/m.62480 type:complete len:290 (-) Transcript_28006:153-1022(-)